MGGPLCDGHFKNTSVFVQSKQFFQIVFLFHVIFRNLFASSDSTFVHTNCPRVALSQKVSSDGSITLILPHQREASCICWCLSVLARQLAVGALQFHLLAPKKTTEILTVANRVHQKRKEHFGGSCSLDFDNSETTGTLGIYCSVEPCQSTPTGKFLELLKFRP